MAQLCDDDSQPDRLRAPGGESQCHAARYDARCPQILNLTPFIGQKRGVFREFRIGLQAHEPRPPAAQISAARCCDEQAEYEQDRADNPQKSRE